MKHRHALSLAAVVFLLSGGAAACARWHDGPMDTPAALYPGAYQGGAAVPGAAAAPQAALAAPSGTDSGRGASTVSGIALAADEIAAMRIYFDFNRWTLKPEGRQALVRTARLLQTHPLLRVRIDGHCDQIGSEEYNFALGERRARAAYSVLVQSGVSPGQLEMATFGKLHPVAPGKDASSRALNRRDEFVLLLPQR